MLLNVFPPSLLIFVPDGMVYAFGSLSHAENAIEAFDLLHECQGAFTTDGRAVAIVADAKGRVSIVGTTTPDLARLQRLLTAASIRRGKNWPTNDPASIATLLLHEQRGLKRPRWLSRRRHGDDPPAPVEA